MGRPKGSKNTNKLVLKSALVGGEKVRAHLRADAPERYLGALAILKRVQEAVEKLRWDGENPNCSLGDAQALWHKVFEMEMRLLEHGIGKPTEYKQVTEERKLTVRIEGFDSSRFRLPEGVIEGEVRELVSVGDHDSSEAG